MTFGVFISVLKTNVANSTAFGTSQYTGYMGIRINIVQNRSFSERVRG